MRRKRRIPLIDGLNRFIRSTVLTTLILFVGVYGALNAKVSVEYDGARIAKTVQKQAKPWFEKTLQGGVKIVKLITD